MPKPPTMPLYVSMSMSSLSHAFCWQAVKCDKITISKDNAVEKSEPLTIISSLKQHGGEQAFLKCSDLEMT